MTTVDVLGGRAPAFFYGTAWKEEVTERLVLEALAAGFRGIDTANQRKHYFEEGVGRAIAWALGEGRIRREELFLQSKYTYRRGQDHRLPYDPRASIAVQVEQSLRSSLAHLAVDRLDSLLLHGPSQASGLGRDDREAWRAMEALADAGLVGCLGISNVTARQVEELIAGARRPPSFVQNRCHAERGWDADVRAVCQRHAIVYQGFSLLTANPQVLAHAGVRSIARRHRATPAQVVFAFARRCGMIPLTGTTDPTHMRQDLAAAELELGAGELAIVTGAGEP